MRICGHEILTPAEDALCYPLDWRHKAAHTIAKARKRIRLPDVIRHDSDIIDFVSFLRSRTSTSSDLKRRCQRVVRWHDSDVTKLVIEALLLTDASYDRIASDIGAGSVDDIRLYQSMFFNVRNASGHVESTLLRLRFCQSQIEDADAAELASRLWKQAALTGGYRLLQDVLGIVQVQEEATSKKGIVDITQTLVEQELLRRVLQGRMENRDLIRMQQIRIETQQTRVDQSESTKAMELVRQILALMAPKLAPLRSVDPAAALALEKRRREAEKNISKQTIVDRGPAAAAADLNRHLRQNFSQIPGLPTQPEKAAHGCDNSEK